jgi:hypothetical protein
MTPSFFSFFHVVETYFLPVLEAGSSRLAFLHDWIQARAFYLTYRWLPSHMVERVFFFFGLLELFFAYYSFVTFIVNIFSQYVSFNFFCGGFSACFITFSLCSLGSSIL